MERFADREGYGEGNYLSIEICHIPLQTILERHDEDFDSTDFGVIGVELSKEKEKWEI